MGRLLTELWEFGAVPTRMERNQRVGYFGGIFCINDQKMPFIRKKQFYHTVQVLKSTYIQTRCLSWLNWLGIGPESWLPERSLMSKMIVTVGSKRRHFFMSIPFGPGIRLLGIYSQVDQIFETPQLRWNGANNGTNQVFVGKVSN
jgi:hypothetical protein